MIKSGIDTIGIVVDTKMKLEDVRLIEGVIEKHTNPLSNGKILVVMKPSVIFNRGVQLTTIKEVELAIKKIMKILKVEKHSINRIDYSFDMFSHVEDNEKLYTLYLELLAVKRNNKMMFKTIKEVVKTGNLKISNRRIIVTIYDCKDKNRNANIRVENRNLDLINLYGDKKTFKELVEIVVKKHLKELIKLEDLIPEVEERYFNILKEQYDKDYKDKKIINFTDFVIKYEGNILTIGILKQLYSHAKMKGEVKNWLIRYRNLRTIKLLKKGDIINFIKTLKKEYKEILKE